MIFARDLLYLTEIIQNLLQRKYGTEIILVLSFSKQRKLIHSYHPHRRNISIFYTELYFLFIPPLPSMKYHAFNCYRRSTASG
jgi:hypothetical protein